MHDFPAGRWRARWIWADPASSADGAPSPRHAVGLRRTVTIGTVPARVPARLCALSRYVLWVNGTEVSRGPVRANPRRQPYDVVDLAPHLVIGDNVFAAIAVRYEGSTPWWLPPPDLGTDLSKGAFLLEARLDGDDSWLVTDGRWRASVLDGWTATPARGISGRGRELLDARAVPAGWGRPDGRDPGWPAAVERQAMAVGEAGRPEPPSYPVGPLVPCPFSATAPQDVPLRPGPGGAYVHERITVGTLVADLEGPAGAEVIVTVAEHLDGAGRPAPGEHDTSVALTLDGGRRALETFDLYGLRGVLVDAPAGVSVHRITVRERTYPESGDVEFRCSDERLERIWAVGRRTVTICSLDAYVDCPTREQRAWTGDAVVHQMVDLTTNTDWGLARWYPHLAASPRADGMLPMAVAGDVEHLDFTVIPDWALHWVHGVWNLYRYVGDAAEVAGLLPVVEGVLRWFEPYCDRGLPTDVTGWVIIDWAAVHTAGACAALCGLWGRGLLELAEMADWLGDSGRARWARAAHARLADGFERLWDPERARYVDSLVGGGHQRPMASQHGQAAAIVGGLAPGDRMARLVEILMDREHLVDAAFSRPDGPVTPNADLPVGGASLRAGHPEPWWDVDTLVVRAQPFFRYVVHDALAAAGRADLVAGACLDWTVALERCDTSWTETWYGGTVSHGWSSTPTRDLVQRVLGVEPAEPGFGVARVAPALGGLEWASGLVPCGDGLIRVEARRDGLLVDSPVPFVHRGRGFDVGRHEVPVA